MRILQVQHAQITVPGDAEAAAREFYCDFLGLQETTKPAALQKRGGFWLQIGDFQVHVGLEDDFERMTTKAHLAYEVDDLQAWREKLTSRGIAPLESVAIPGCDRFEFRDPFGNRVEFLQMKVWPFSETV